MQENKISPGGRRLTDGREETEHAKEEANVPLAVAASCHYNYFISAAE